MRRNSGKTPIHGHFGTTPPSTAKTVLRGGGKDEMKEGAHQAQSRCLEDRRAVPHSVGTSFSFFDSQLCIISSGFTEANHQGNSVTLP